MKKSFARSLPLLFSASLAVVGAACITDEQEPLADEPAALAEQAPAKQADLTATSSKEQPPGEIEPLARDFCCVIKMDPPVICHQWHTTAIWAGPKCVAYGVGLNRRGSTLYGGSCGDHPECW